MEYVGKFVVYSFGIVLSYALRGLVVRQYWAWFIQPTFNLPPITVPVALGISTLIGYVTYQWGLKRDEEQMKPGVSIVVSVGIALFLFGLGWLLMRFMQ